MYNYFLVIETTTMIIMEHGLHEWGGTLFLKGLIYIFAIVKQEYLFSTTFTSVYRGLHALGYSNFTVTALEVQKSI
jgi:hypothetical protein